MKLNDIYDQKVEPAVFVTSLGVLGLPLIFLCPRGIYPIYIMLIAAVTIFSTRKLGHSFSLADVIGLMKPRKSETSPDQS